MIGKVIKYLFDNDTKVNDTILGRVYPLAVYHNMHTPTTPYVVYETIGVQYEGSKDNARNKIFTRVRFTLIGNSYSTLNYLSEYMYNALERKSVTVDEVELQTAKYITQRDLYSTDSNTYAVQVDYEFIHFNTIN